MNRRKFITTCACCAFAGGALTLLNEKRINAKAGGFIMNHVGIHIAEHCNLQCKYCGHFSCIAQEEFYDLDKFKQDMKQMSFVFKKKLGDMQLFGGEPLLNPQINEYVKISRQYFPKTRINIITNGILLNDMPESFWKTLNKNNAGIVPSIYPVEVDWKSVIEKAQKYNVGIYGDRGHEEPLTTDNIDKFRISVFGKMTLNKSDKMDIDRSKCKQKFICSNMYDGKLYPCATIAYIRHLNKKFNTDFIVTEGDYLDLYKVKNIDEVKEFIKTPILPFCRYCKKGTPGIKWENSPVHTLSEWT